MSRKPKISAEIKTKVVKECLSGHLSISEAARQCDVHDSSVRIWHPAQRAEAFPPRKQIWSTEPIPRN